MAQQQQYNNNRMEKPSFGSKRRDHAPDDFSMGEWSLKAKIGRENTNSRRFSASNLMSFRENEKSFRSNVTISSTVSSPGYTTRDEINPSTYSFTTALKALQAKTVYPWEYLSPEHGGFTLNSKWNDAEKYICNPLSGQVPLECLSSKTLSGRLVVRSRVTMSAPLIYRFRTKSGTTEHQNRVNDITTLTQLETRTRDAAAGTQSPRADLVSSITGATSQGPSTPSIEERLVKRKEAETEDSSVSSEEPKSEAKQVVEVEETREKLQHDVTKRKKAVTVVTKKMMKMMSCSNGGGCLSSIRNFVRRNKTRKNKTIDTPTSPSFVCHVNVSFRK